MYEVVSRGLISISRAASSVKTKSTPTYPVNPGIRLTAEQARSTPDPPALCTKGTSLPKYLKGEPASINWRLRLNGRERPAAARRDTLT
jgi:hypothetical protein